MPFVVDKSCRKKGFSIRRICLILMKFSGIYLLNVRFIVTINFLWLFLMVPWVGLQCVSVAFPDHIHLFVTIYSNKGLSSLSRSCLTISA